MLTFLPDPSLVNKRIAFFLRIYSCSLSASEMAKCKSECKLMNLISMFDSALYMTSRSIVSSARSSYDDDVLLHYQCNSVQLKSTIWAHSGHTQRTITVLTDRTHVLGCVIAIFISLETNSKTDCSKKTK